MLQIAAGNDFGGAGQIVDRLQRAAHQQKDGQQQHGQQRAAQG